MLPQVSAIRQLSCYRGEGVVFPLYITTFMSFILLFLVSSSKTMSGFYLLEHAV